MLKKLVKYGNSNALVLDKAILELLNMREGSIVKITTDGKSLILTPHEPVQTEQVSSTVTPEGAMLEASVEHLKEQFKKLRPEATAEELQRMVAETKGRMAKYTDESAKLHGNKEYKKELEQLQKKYRDNPAKLMHEISALQHKYAPQLRAVCQELDTSPLAQIGHETVKQTHANEEIEKLQKTYMAIHEKYKSARDAFDKLQNNEEYLHESALLAQQQTKPIDMKKYVLATQELLCKYIPQWRAYQDELLEAAQEYENRTKKED